MTGPVQSISRTRGEGMILFDISRYEKQNSRSRDRVHGKTRRKNDVIWAPYSLRLLAFLPHPNHIAGRRVLGHIPTTLRPRSFGTIISILVYLSYQIKINIINKSLLSIIVHYEAYKIREDAHTIKQNKYKIRSNKYSSYLSSRLVE